MSLIETRRWAPRRRVLAGAPESMHAASTPHELSPPASLTSKLVRMPECRPSENRHYTGISAILSVDRSAESRFGHRVIGSKAEVTWYYETVANHSLATPSASDSHRYAFWHRYYSFSFHDFSTELDFHESSWQCQSYEAVRITR